MPNVHEETARQRRGMLAVFAGATTIGLAPIFVRYAHDAAPLMVGFYRMVFGLPVVLAIALSERGRWSARGMRWALLAGLCFFGDLSLWHTSIRLTNASLATLFVCLAPFWVALFGALVGGRRMRKLGWLGLGLALLGAFLLAVGRGSFGFGSFGLGELCGLGASLCYAGYTVCLSRARTTLSPARALAIAITIAGPLFATVCALRGDAFSGFATETWLALIALGLVVQTLAWMVITWGFGHVDARIGALSLLVQPVSTVVLGYALLGETLSPMQLVGALVVLAGIGIVSDPTRVFERASPALSR